MQNHRIFQANTWKNVDKKFALFFFILCRNLFCVVWHHFYYIDVCSCVSSIFFLFYKIQCLCHIVWNLIICCFDRMKFPYYSELICLRFRFAIFDYYKEIYEYGTILHWSTYCGCMNIWISLSHTAFLILILILIPQQFKFSIFIQQICWTWRSYNFLCSFKIRSVFKRCQHLFKLD